MRTEFSVWCRIVLTDCPLPVESMKRVQFDKKGKFKPISWQRAFDEMETHAKKAAKRERTRGGCCICIWTIYSNGRVCSSEDDESWISFNAIDPECLDTVWLVLFVGFYQTSFGNWMTKWML